MSTWPPVWLAGLQSAWLTGCLTSGSDCRVERPSVPGRLLWVHGRLVGWLAYSLPGLQVVSLVGPDCRVERPSVPGRLLWVHGRLVGWLAYSLPGLQVVSLVGSDCRVERPSVPGRLLWVHGRLVGWLAYSLPGLQVVSLVGLTVVLRGPLSQAGFYEYMAAWLVGWLTVCLAYRLSH